MGSVVGLMLLLLLLFLCHRKRQGRQPAKPPKPVATARAAPAEVGTSSSSKDDITGGSAEVERNKLVFFESAGRRYDVGGEKVEGCCGYEERVRDANGGFG
ncbi:putative inactive receptor kinase [Sesbania bispinosa]|nr:putative inactive receptor kinase [Sesbania bispinosa]